MATKNNIHSILFDKNKFTVDSAMNWIITHGFKIKKIHMTKNQIRFRQFPPKKNYKYATKRITNGIEFVFAY